MQKLISPFRDLMAATWRSAAVAFAAWISIVACLDPGGSYPSMPQGPGLTVDEIFNVEQGVYLVEQARALGWYNLIPGTSAEAYRRENHYNPDHPPLGRYWLGLHHHLAWWIAPPLDPDGYFATVCARTGSATAFALTVWLLGAYITLTSKLTSTKTHTTQASAATSIVASPAIDGEIERWMGPLAGLALILMPRVYGHAHLAALETFTNLTCTVAVLGVAAWWSGPTVPTRRAAMAAGVLMGLALLSKIQAVLIPVPVIIWALWRWRWRAVVPLMIWGGVAIVVFYASWPYLWHQPVGHLMEYLGRTTQRVTLYCFYLGTRYADKQVPWHYSFVMFAITVPVALQGLGLLGLRSLFAGRTCAGGPSTTEQHALPQTTRAWQDRLVLACLVFPLVVFALPGTAVYDGERLFLTVFPLWAIFIGRGAATAISAAARLTGKRIALTIAGVLFAAQFASNLRIHPVYLSYYNLAVSVRGAERMGLERNYWGDALTRSLLQEAVSRNRGYNTVEIRPSLHPLQVGDLLRQSPVLRNGLTNSETATRPLRFAFRRRADLSDEEFLDYQHGGGPRRQLATYEDQSPVDQPAGKP